MEILLDTNILLYYLRDERNIIAYIDHNYKIFANGNVPIISIVSIGELKSLALRNNWGNHRLNYLETFLSQFLKADINAVEIFEKYAEIDTFSQGKGKRLIEKGISARNMGKNDIWIAATASVLGIPLLTTDKDFIHLDDEFIKLEYLDIKQIPPSV